MEATANRINHSYIWVIPKSGNVSLNIFFNVYSLLLKGSPITDEDLTLRGVDPGPFEKLTFVIRHAEWPNFSEIAKAEELARWQTLSYGDRIPWPRMVKRNPILRECLNNHDAEFLAQCRMVFVYRNPLDQLISLYKHYHALPPDNAYTKADEPSQSLENFIFESNGVSSYIKMFYTFHVAKLHYPEILLFVSYEQLIANREQTLRKIIKFIDVPFNEAAFQQALKLTSLESLRQVESRQNRGLLILSNPNSRHIRNGGIGQWKSKMSPDLIQKIEKAFNSFDLSLTMFDFGGSSIQDIISSNADTKINHIASRRNTFKP